MNCGTLTNNNGSNEVRGINNKHIKSSDDLKLKRRLISLVKKYRILYDNKHKHFSNVEKKEKIWEKIARSLQLEGTFSFTRFNIGTTTLFYQKGSF